MAKTSKPSYYNDPIGLRVVAGHVYFDTLRASFTKMAKGQPTAEMAFSKMPYGFRYGTSKLTPLRNKVIEALLLASKDGHGLTLAELDAQTYAIKPKKSSVPSAIESLNKRCGYHVRENIKLPNTRVNIIEERDGKYYLSDAFSILPSEGKGLFAPPSRNDQPK